MSESDLRAAVEAFRPISRLDNGTSIVLTRDLDALRALAATPEPTLDEEHCCNDPDHMSPEYLAAIDAARLHERTEGLNAPSTRAGRWLVDRARWDEGMRGFFVRINAIGGPDDMHRHVLAIEAEAEAEARRRIVEEMENEGVVTWGDPRHRGRFLDQA